jgi:hypothetical protein
VPARRHLFLAATSSAMGELNLARGIAWELHERGEVVDFLAPESVGMLFRDTPFRHLAVDPMLQRMPEMLPRLLARERTDVVFLVDQASVLLALETAQGQDTGFLYDLPVPLAALDVWDLPETDLKWDFGVNTLAIPPRALEVRRRLVPVPFAKPLKDGTHYDALPRLEPLAAEARRDMRAEMGLGTDDRLVLMLSSRWQMPEAQMWKHHRRLAEHLPALALEAVASLGERVHVAHVGPQAFAGREVLGERYHWFPQLAPDRFQGTVASADLLLSFATSSPSTFTALALGVPVVLAVNSRRGRTVEELLEGMPDAAPPVQRFLERAAPLYPFLLWPLGLHGLLSPVLAGNPFSDALRAVELLDWGALRDACAQALFDGAARESALQRQAEYCALVHGLPSGADLLLAQL